MDNFKTTLLNITIYGFVVYVACNRYDHRQLWDQLFNFGHHLDRPWCVSGDFSIISTYTKRHGGYTPNANAMEDFNIMILDCSLLDIVYNGNDLTWNNN